MKVLLGRPAVPHYAILLDKAYRLSEYFVTIPPVDLLLLHRSILQQYFFLSAGEVTSSLTGFGSLLQVPPSHSCCDK